ncbi:Beta-glucanase, GH16 family [Nostoc flagelliforme CCNUN1]|uniref:Beta-glucanase, GH16 family n=1 Tax=Nostoc flagelliforme CCNUN1 TaxID=2038116 RepID=A0A2K8SS47_9NOSO|nr:calcium-binding protein [Nostoc flagelliforme]AUB38314.1 Beta-glucanase, GH16 family [Nostoc flagelliforme CCNUN1]
MALIRGNFENNSLPGTELSDQIYGYGGADTLTGGAGSDYLEGGAGDDYLTGDSGRDTFVLDHSGGGIDRITDFSVKGDILKINTPPIGSTNTFSTASQGDDTLIGKSGNDSSVVGVGNDILTGGKDSDALASIKSSKNAIKFPKSTTDVLLSIEASSEGMIVGAPIDESAILQGIIGGGVGLPNYCRYNVDTGALFYQDQQLAWLPPKLSFA